jgi:hypothetical protein
MGSVQEHLDIRSPRITRQLMNDMGANDGSAIRTDEARWQRPELGHLQATAAVNQRVPQVSQPLKPALRANAFNQGFEVSTELRLGAFASAASADLTKRASCGSKAGVQEWRPESQNADHRSAEAVQRARNCSDEPNCVKRRHRRRYLVQWALSFRELNFEPSISGH